MRQALLVCTAGAVSRDGAAKEGLKNIAAAITVPGGVAEILIWLLLGGSGLGPLPRAPPRLCPAQLLRYGLPDAQLEI